MKMIFRPDNVRTRILGLISALFIVPLLFIIMDIYAVQVDKIPPPTSDPVVFGLALIIELIIFIPVLYGILSLFRSKVILADDKLIVINGFKKKTIQLGQIKEIAYKTLSKGQMPYEAGVITYRANGSEHELELPIGWRYLQDLVKELKNISGDKLVINKESFMTWQKWYQTPFLKKTFQVLMIIVLLVLYFVPPTLAWFWVEGKLDSFGFNSPWKEWFESQKLPGWIFYILALAVYTWILALLLKGVDFIRKIAKSS